MYNLLQYLDGKIVEYDNYLEDEVGPSLSYDILDDNTIDLTFGWCSYEEGEETNAVISFSTKTISTKMSGYSVYEGDYDNEDIIIFKTETEVIDWLKTEIE